jgi:hypothetical protein
MIHVTHLTSRMRSGFINRMCLAIAISFFFLCRFGGDLSGQRRVGRKRRSFSRFDGGGMFDPQGVRCRCSQFDRAHLSPQSGAYPSCPSICSVCRSPGAAG